jgi:molybdenum cofactor biosynthesis protein B
MKIREHHESDPPSVACAILTISDTRTPQSDESGALIRELLERNDHAVRVYEILPDEMERVRARVLELCQTAPFQVLLINGGTGIAPRDTTVDAVLPLFEKRLDGFGELFRMLSFDGIGAGAMLSRAVAGIRGNTAVFVMPGSPAAVRLAMERLIVPQLRHLAGLLKNP